MKAERRTRQLTARELDALGIPSQVVTLKKYHAEILGHYGIDAAHVDEIDRAAKASGVSFRVIAALVSQIRELSPHTELSLALADAQTAARKANTEKVIGRLCWEKTRYLARLRPIQVRR